MPGNGEMNRQDIHYAQSQGVRLLESAVQELGPIFTIGQLKPIADRQGLSERHLRKLISSLAGSGRMEILKRGTYAVKSPLFVNEIPPFAVAASLVQPCAISHWSALAHHGLTTQLPAVVQASTPRKVVTPEMRAGRANSPRGRAIWKALGVEVEFIHVQERHFFGHQRMWINSWQQIAITDAERTALDLVARPDVFGGMKAAIEILEGALQQIQIEKLAQYALQYDSGALIKRLGWLLEQFGAASETIIRLQKYPVTTYYRLDPRGPVQASRNVRWRIIENLRRPTHA